MASRSFSKLADGPAVHEEDAASPSSPSPSPAEVDAPPTAGEGVTDYQQFKLLLWKNWIRKKRAWGHTLCEYLCPLMFVLILVLIRSVVSKTTVPLQYFDDPAFSRSLASVDGVRAAVHTSACGCEHDLDAWFDGRRANREMVAFTASDAVAAQDPAATSAFVSGAMAHVQQALSARLLPSDTLQCGCDAPLDIVVGLLEYVNANQTARGMFRQFPTEGALNAYTSQADYDRDPTIQVVDKAFVLTSLGTPANQWQWSYRLRLNGSDVPSSQFSVVDPTQAYSNDTFTSTWYDSGVLTLQLMVDQFIIRSSAPTPTPLEGRGASSVSVSADPYLSDVTLYPMPESDHLSDSFASTMSTILGFYLMLSFLWPYSRLVKQIVDEKERKIKEQLLISGVRTAPYLASWIVLYMIGFALLCLTIALLGRVSLFPHTNFLLLFLFLYSFVLALIAMATLFSSVFESAKLAGFLSPALLYAFILPYFAVASNSASYGAKLAVCILPSSALALGAVKITQLESNGVGAHFGNLGDTSYNFSVGASITWLLADAVIYLFLAWYCDKVMPKTFGQTERWYFLCTGAYWRRTLPCLRPSDDRERYDIPLVRAAVGDPAGSSGSAAASSPTIEPVHPSLHAKVGIRLKGLTKRFDHTSDQVSTLTRLCMSEKDKKTFTAVDGIDMDMYIGQITVVLGHNGAGKTTTINLLSGMVPPTSGTATILGLDITRQMSRVRSSMGYCAQHSVVWEELTVREHLELFGALKGLRGRALDQAVAVAIDEVSLAEKRDRQTKELSGGQARRLSLAIALIGDSRVVFLDEPTSGVDPFSRRAIWELLQRKKQGRVIILTTHFMDEADELGDRISIMSRGQIRCAGSSHFLKKLYGVGYSLVISKASARDMPEDADEFRRHYHQPPPASSPQTPQSPGVGHQPPWPSSPVSNDHWSPPALTQLVLSRVPGADRQSHSAGELTFRLPLGTGGTILPDLFDYLDAHKVDLGISGFGLSITTLEDVFLRVAREDEAAAALEPPSGLNYISPQEHAAMMRAQQLAKERAATTNEQTSLLGGQSLAGAPNLAVSVSSASHDAAQHAAMMATLQASSSDINTVRQFKALLAKRRQIIKRDKRALCCQIVMPILFLVLGLSAITGGLNQTFDTLPLRFAGQFDSPNLVYTNPSVNRFVASALGAGRNGGVNQTLDGVTSLSEMDHLMLAMRDDRETSHYGAYYSSNASVTSAYTTLINISATFGQPTFVNYANEAILQGVTGVPQAQIAVELQPFDLTQTQTSGQHDASGFITSLIITSAFSFIPASVCVFVVFERENHSKHLQMISGVGIVSYWLSNFVFDLLLYLVPAGVCTVILIAGHNPNFQGANLPVVLATFLVYGASVIPFTYLCSFLFDSHTTAQNAMTLVYLLSGNALVIVNFLLFQLSPGTGRALRHVFRLMPNFSLGDSLLYLSLRHEIGDASEWSMDISGYDLLYSVLETVVYFLLVLAVEYVQAHPEALDACRGPGAKTEEQRLMSGILPSDDAPAAGPGADASGALIPEDAAVAAERAYMQSPNAANPALIQLHGLRKVYPLSGGRVKVAVDNLWFSVQAGECFGYLGVNGAGKSTTLKMLTGDVPPTSGFALLHGYDLRYEPQQVRARTGYCPQHDALHANQTAVETLEFYARVRGIPERNIPAMVAYLVDRLGLRVNAYQPVHGYSGGTKRKLSVGVALIGSPPVIFLDEPSTGMDPVSRRFIWSFISETMADRALILTTHSLEEAEALSSRIGIINAGRLVCLGTSQQLKSTHGRGFLVDLRGDVARIDEIRGWLAREFVGSKEVECFEGHLKVQTNPSPIDGDGGATTMADMFRKIEAGKAKYAIDDYAISQSSLESIFIEMAKQTGTESMADLE